MDLGISGRIAVITGSNRGIGFETAKILASEGCHVAINGRDPEKLARAKSAVEAVAASGVRVITVCADVALVDDRQRICHEVHTELGLIDILVNNAGGSLGGGSFLNASVEQFHSIFDLNFFPALDLSKRVLTGMIERRWGRIVHVSSIWGKESGGGAAYNAAKAAMISLSKAMAADLTPHGVLVNTVAPGSVMFEGGGWAKRQHDNPGQIAEFVQRDLPRGRFGEPQEVASAIAFLCSERASLISGSCLVVDGAQSKSNL